MPDRTPTAPSLLDAPVPKRAIQPVLYTEYRVVCQRDPQDPESQTFSVHQVMVDADGFVNGMEFAPICLVGEDMESLMDCLDAIVSAMDKPVLDYDGLTRTWQERAMPVPEDILDDPNLLQEQIYVLFRRGGFAA